MNPILIIFLVIYVVGIVAISLKLRDIIRDPEKYEDWELVKKASIKEQNTPHIKLFKSLSTQYALFVNILGWFLWLPISYGILVLIHKIMAGESRLIMPGGAIAGIIPMLFFGIILAPVVTYFIKTPFFAIAFEEAWCFGGRAKNIKVGFICLLVSFTLLFPFYGLSANCYVHFDSEGISSSKYFELEETYTPYEDVVKAKIWMYYEDEKPNTVYYEITLPNGVTLDIASVNTKVSEETLMLHKYLEEKGTCDVEVTPLTLSDMKYLQEHASPEKLEIIKYIFEGFHR